MVIDFRFLMLDYTSFSIHKTENIKTRHLYWTGAVESTLDTDIMKMNT